MSDRPGVAYLMTRRARARLLGAPSGTFSSARSGTFTTAANTSEKHQLVSTKLAFQEFWELPPALAETFLKRWYFWATHSRLPSMIRVARTLKKNWDGVLRWFHSRVSNGMLEAMNSLLQAAKARARGYRTTDNLIAMAYLVSGKLHFRLPI